MAPRSRMGGEVPGSCLPRARGFIAFCSDIPLCSGRVPLLTHSRGGCSPGWGRVIAPSITSNAPGPDSYLMPVWGLFPQRWVLPCHRMV